MFSETQYLGRDSGRDGELWKVRSHDRTGAHDGALSDPDAVQHDGTGAEPDIIANDNRILDHDPLLHHRHIEFLCLILGPTDVTVRRDEDVRADVNAADRGYDGIAAHVTLLTDRQAAGFRLQNATPRDDHIISYLQPTVRRATRVQEHILVDSNSVTERDAPGMSDTRSPAEYGSPAAF